MRDKDREFICFFQVGGCSFSFVLIRKKRTKKNEIGGAVQGPIICCFLLVFFDIFCIFVNETATYYKIYQISGF
ncbi:hypothetical protein BACOVA_04218 [Bacteroides ovatus ATCC 8483]|uniref:Uncharacterized protein n=1 Tax=Bacteroides ovatus (strain ATCC 8483 / DSM 1896 / JCM 5824 / BCRC 10623 / CCUG 4943 / NCTC 11153) TaxID=411476 RepID=A0AAN3A4M5_BACO1|nr:hypothetical protein BACOVA_04218 [Bacteroides ovatus ATCC 8483]